tara:strand:+ start:247 stop:1230 length:984 start_codon:yes stop_codon:yes gene_type:complete
LAGDIPQFHRGKFGNVSAQNINAIARSTIQSRNDLETSPTPFSREAIAAPGVWPMLAKITGMVSKGGEPLGFSWKEVKYDTEFVEDSEARQYIEESGAYCIPIGLPKEEYGTLDLTDAVVVINWMASKQGTILYFELPSYTPGAVVDVLRITEAHAAEEGDFGGPQPLTPYCSGFGLNGQYKCSIVTADESYFGSEDMLKARPSFGGDNAGFTEVYAYNLLEYGAGYLGGEQEVDDCEILEQLATIPPGTMVLGKRIAQWQDNEDEGEDVEPTFSRAYAFSVVNDACVQCCVGEEGMALTTFQRGVKRVENRVRPLSPTSINEEMLR